MYTWILSYRWDTISHYQSKEMIVYFTGFVWYLVMVMLAQLLTSYSGSCTPSSSPYRVCMLPVCNLVTVH